MSITNEDFLRAIFDDQYYGAWVTGFSAQPENAGRNDWKGAQFSNGGHLKLQSANIKNTFTVISVFNKGPDGLVHRRKTQHDKTYLIMIDDVGPKIDRFTLESVYGLTPSYRLETSKGNEQWGLILDTPCADVWKVEQLQAGIVKALGVDGVDPGMFGVTRYCRLPVGLNNKKGTNWSHKLHNWCPHVKFSIDVLAEMFGITLTAPDDRQSSTNKTPGYDHVLDALYVAGLVKSEIKPGGYDITCPWVSTHTGKDDSGTMYFETGYENEAGDVLISGGFKCHHGHCEQKGLRDLREHLYKSGHTAVIEHDYIDTTPSDTPIEIKTPGDSLDILADFRVTDWHTRKPKPIDWVIDNVMPLRKTGVLIAAGGSGKTFLGVDLAIAVALGQPVCNGLWSVTKPGGVLALFAEENAEELHRRYYNITQSMSRYSSPDLARIHESLFIGTVNAKNNLLTERTSSGNTRLTKRLSEIVKIAQAVSDIRLIIIDPVARFNGGDENSSTDVTRFVEALELLAYRTGAAVLVMHHVNKNSIRNGDDTAAAARGSSSLTDGVRLQLNMRYMTEREAVTHRIAPEERLRYLSIISPMSNVSATGGQSWLYRGAEGVLTAAILAEADENRYEDNQEILESIISIIKDERTRGWQYSIRGFHEAFGDIIKQPRRRIKEVLRFGINSDVLHLLPPDDSRRQGPQDVLVVIKL